MDSSQGGYVYPSDAAVPDVEFAVGDTLFKVNADDFSLGDAGSGMLFGGIQSRGDNPFDILGDGELSIPSGVVVIAKSDGPMTVFLKSVYVVFDQGNTRIGMAQRS